jgi:hypothetical protein
MRRSPGVLVALLLAASLPQPLLAQYYPAYPYGAAYYNGMGYPAAAYGGAYYRPAYPSYYGGYGQPVYGYPTAAYPTTTYYYAQPRTYTYSQSNYPNAYAPSPPATTYAPAAPSAPTYTQVPQPAYGPTVPAQQPGTVNLPTAPLNETVVTNPAHPEKLPMGTPEVQGHVSTTPEAVPETVKLKNYPSPAPAAPAPTAPVEAPVLPQAGAACGEHCGETCGAACAAGQACCDTCAKKECHLHPYVFGDYLYLTARGVNVPFGQPFQGAVATTAVPFDTVGIAHTGYATGYRAGAGVALDDRAWIDGTFTWFGRHNDDLLTAPNGTAIKAFLVFPTTVIAGPPSLSQVATSRYDIDFRFADADFHHSIWCGPHWSVDWLAGARYAHLEQDLLVNYSILTTTTVNTHINFDGGGPKVGLEGEYRWRWGVYTYGKGILDLLAGHFGATYDQRNNVIGQQAHTEVAEDRIVPQLELELGAGWQSPKGHVRVSGGYYVGAWFNTLTTPSFIQGALNNNFTTNGNNFRDTLTFDGFVGRVEFRY